MNSVSDTQVFAELASARDSLGELHNDLYDFTHRAEQDATPEGRLLAREVRRILKDVYAVQSQFSALANCYL